MEVKRSNLLDVSVIEKTGERIRLDPTQTSYETISEKVREALRRNAEVRWYYLPQTNFEVIKTAVPPNHEQPWHSHHEVHEAMIVLSGQVTVLEEFEGKTSEGILRENDFVVFRRGEGTYHTMRNCSSEYAHTLTYKFLGPDEKDGKLFRTDWHAKPSQRREMK